MGITTKEGLATQKSTFPVEVDRTSHQRDRRRRIVDKATRQHLSSGENVGYAVGVRGAATPAT